MTRIPASEIRPGDTIRHQGITGTVASVAPTAVAVWITLEGKGLRFRPQQTTLITRVSQGEAPAPAAPEAPEAPAFTVGQVVRHRGTEFTITRLCEATDYQRVGRGHRAVKVPAADLRRTDSARVRPMVRLSELEA